MITLVEGDAHETVKRLKDPTTSCFLTPTSRATSITSTSSSPWCALAA